MEDKHPKNLEDVYEIILMRNADNFKMSRKTFIISGNSFVMSKEDRKFSGIISISIFTISVFIVNLKNKKHSFNLFQIEKKQLI